MIDLEPLKLYFNSYGKTITVGKFYFNLILHQDDEESFSVNVKVRQQDTKEEHLIRFRVALEKHEGKEGSFHSPEKPHFELDFYKVDERSFSATLCFEFDNPSDSDLMKYAEGTIVLITRMLRNFFNKYALDLEKLSELVSEKMVFDELISSESVLIDALYDCYKNSSLIVRQKGLDPIVIITKHKLDKFMNFEDLQPIYLPLLEKIESS